jgi:acetate kinase
MESFGISLDLERNRRGGTESSLPLVSTDASRVRVFVIPADEDLVLAENAFAVLAGT